MDQPGVDPATDFKEGAADEPHELEIEERNAFYESLSLEAKDRFLTALRSASGRGLSEAAAWNEAVVAAETAYADTGPAGADAGLEPDPADLADRDLSRVDEANL